MKSTSNAVWLVARRELRTRVRTRSFVLGTLFMLLVVLAYPALMFFIGSSNAPASGTDVGVTPQATSLTQPLGAGTPGDAEWRIQRVDDRQRGENLVREGELDVLVTGTSTEPELVFESGDHADLRRSLANIAWQRSLDEAMAEAGADPGQVRGQADRVEVTTTNLDSSDPQQAQRLVIAFVAAFLLYMFLIMTGQMIAQGVVEEKSNRVVEMLLATISSTQLMAGKILGIGLTGLIQFAVIGVVGFGAVSATATLVLPLGAVAGLLGWILVWFLLGFLLYATLLAAASSLVSRQEDLQSVITPVIMTLVVPFVVGVSVLPADPNSTLGTVLSFVPGFSPVLMPMRLALGVAAPWEAPLAAVFSLVASAVVLWLGGRIYSNAILRTGARVKLREALRAS
ncbi:ABC-2 type transport system permease protein [Actinopolyspora biskrensis]|uniref:ABC-2 type transport system permease protein n=1 Tax=Actinopolyspora biskrensis TaxID=1470178 RepID=A0A852Z6H8_9ACTN|nr:ABC-2 type transport system permease protein [Actinopolyspora biskrensis]